MSEVVDEIRKRGYWRVVIRPVVRKEKRLAYAELFPLVERIKVGFGGWDFPHINQNITLFKGDDYVANWIAWQHFREYWRLHQSGQFLWVGGIMDDWRSESTWWPPNPGTAAPKSIGVGEILRKLTQIFEFASRMSVSSAGDGNCRVQVDLEGTSGRHLVGDNPRRFWHVVVPYEANAPRIEMSDTFDAQTLTSSRDIARAWATELYSRFGWNPHRKSSSSGKRRSPMRSNIFGARFASGVSLLIVLLGCSATRHTEGHWTPGTTLAVNPRILLLQVTGSEPEACQKITAALLGMLSQKQYRVVVSTAGQESAASAMDHAAADGFDYVLAGNITAWGDEVGLTVDLFEVSSRASVASAAHHAHKRPGHWPSDPEDFVPELADCSLARVFGWTPKVYTGDPPR